MDTTCIMCPMGCSLHVEKQGDKIVVSGNTCKRGEVYGTAEFTTPIRMVTSLVKYNDGVVSVKTSKPVEKRLINDVLSEIAKVKIVGSVHNGDVLVKNIASSGADLICTGNL